MRVLIAEDDEKLAAMLAATLESAGFVAEREADGEVAHFRGENEDFDAVLLDLGLPSMDGLTVLRRWRKAGRLTPILILTARAQWEERVEGIEAGADDYLVKPFHMEELIARLRAIIRRANGIAATPIQFSNYQLDTRLMQLSRDGVPIDLTPQEYKALVYLVSQLVLTEHIYNQDFELNSNSIEVLVGRLRRRLGSDLIKTRRGFGYYIEEND